MVVCRSFQQLKMETVVSQRKLARKTRSGLNRDTADTSVNKVLRKTPDVNLTHTHTLTCTHMCAYTCTHNTSPDMSIQIWNGSYD